MKVLSIIISVMLLIFLRKLFEEKGFKGSFLLFFVLLVIGFSIKSYKVIFASTFTFNTFLTILVLLLICLFSSLVFTTCWYIAYRITRTTFSFIFFGGLIALLLFYLFYYILHKLTALITTKAIILCLLK